MKIIKQLRLVIVTTAILGVVSSCQQEDEIAPLKQENQTFLRESDMKNMIRLGKELENPYSVDNMQKAYENLSPSYANGRTSSDGLIPTTHLYIRFKPRSEAELSILHQDTTLILYTYPLHYEIAQMGDFYHDPTVPLNRPTYQYCAVKVNKPLPRQVEHEILARLFIPDENSDSDLNDNLGGRLELDEVPVDVLVDEALRITGNLDEEVTNNSNGRTEGTSWRPKGKIQFDDDILGRVPLTGAKVRARRWFTTHQGITNASGDFSCGGTFKRDANYSIKWDRNDFDIRNGEFTQALYNGPKKRGDWNLNISSGKSRMYAIVHQALNDYYYGNRLGLKSPPQNSMWKTKLKVSVFDTSNDTNGNDCSPCRFLGMFSRIRIWSNGRTSRAIYATTIHEIAHASHWELRQNNWNFELTETKVQESWARGVQWAIGNLRYPNYYGGGTNRAKGYTQVVVDMIDGRATFDHNAGSENLTEDDVSGYTIKQIEDALLYVATWEEWETNIKNRYDNATEENLATLFAHWN